MTTLATRLNERRERDRLERLSWQLRDAVLECKLGMHDDTIPLVGFPPATLSVCVAGGLAGAAVQRSNDPTLRPDPLSRRQFLSRGPLVAGGAAAGLLLAGETQQAQAWFWGRVMWPAFGFVLREVFSHMISWGVNRGLNYAFGFRCAPAYELVKDDLTEVKTARPTTSSFHNQFATPVEISNSERHFEEKAVGKSKLGVKAYLLPFDTSLPEMAQQKREHDHKKKNDKTPDEQEFASTRRFDPDVTKHGEEFKKVCAAYGYKPGDTKAIFRRASMDVDGYEYLYYGAEVGKAHRIMRAKIRKA